MTTPKKQPVHSYMKYSGLAFQMVFILVGGWFLGGLGDSYFNLDKPYLALTLAILLLVAFFYKLYKDLI